MVWSRLRLVVGLTLVGTLVVGCTSESGSAPVQLPPSSSVIPSATDDPPPTSLPLTTVAPSSIAPKTSESPPATTAVEPSTTALTSGSAAESSNLWPDDLTAKEVEDVKAALAAFEGYMATVDRSQADPGMKDWAPDVRKFAADPAAGALIQTLQLLANYGIRQVSPPTYRVMHLRPGVPQITVDLTYCLATAGREAVDQDGNTIPDESKNETLVTTVEVTNYGGELGWLVNRVDEAVEGLKC